MEIQRFYRKTEYPHVNTLPPRAYFIPFEKTQDPAGEREASSRFLSLNGTWDFRWFPDVESLELERPGFPGGVECTDRLAVPGCWQLETGRGWDPPNYINQDYPFPVDPPHLPDVVPCGFYRRSFTLPKAENRRYFLNFDGVSSCFYLWLNGVWIGYSQVSHANSEFEITEELQNGENTVEALVVKHCTGSYMEDQDFFRLSGIFRDVYILTRDAAHIRDIDCVPCVSEDLTYAELTVTPDIPADLAVTGSLYAPDGSFMEEQTGRTLCFRVADPVLWSSETPYLYSLRITAGDEAVCLPVGLRRVEIRDRCLLLNGQKLKLRGVNRHDTSPETGYYVSPELMLEDLYLLKRANVNAIRTSHYPNDPRFPAMCDRLGFLLIDEADLETHGMGYNYGDWYWDYWSHICDTPLWKAQCVDRVSRLFERDKNHPCVVMWSLGNESGCGENHRAMAAYIRARRADALIHYENARLEYGERVGRDFSDISDVESRMYASLEYLEEYLNDPDKTKPFFYCEYVSAWSTGDIPLHWRDFEKYDNYCGGCVWELTDHAVNIGTPEHPRYRYGGDFGDYPNDGISCLDGVVYPNRTPRPGYYDMKECYKPFEVSFEGGVLTVKNKRYFTSLSDCALGWTLERDGREIRGGWIDVLDIPPQKERSYALFDKTFDSGFAALYLHVEQKENTPWAQKGYVLGTAQFILHNAPVSLPAGEAHAVETEETRAHITVKCGETAFTFDRRRGQICSARAGEEELLCEPIGLSVFRPWLPNSGNRAMWERARYDHAAQQTYETVLVRADETAAVIRVRASLAAPAMPPAVRAEITYTVSGNGKLRADVRAGVTHNAPPLPRFGLAFAMPGAFSRMEYLGYGPVETYPDRYKSQTLRLFACSVRENFEPYIRPAECGAHYGTKTASLTNAAGIGLAFADLSAAGFVFTARPYSDEALYYTAHNDELPPSDRVYVHLDYKQHADNPGFADREPERDFSEKEFEFSFELAVIG